MTSPITLNMISAELDQTIGGQMSLSTTNNSNSSFVFPTNGNTRMTRVLSIPVINNKDRVISVKSEESSSIAGSNLMLLAEAATSQINQTASSKSSAILVNTGSPNGKLILNSFGTDHMYPSTSSICRPIVSLPVPKPRTNYYYPYPQVNGYNVNSRSMQSTFYDRRQHYSTPNIQIGSVTYSYTPQPRPAVPRKILPKLYHKVSAEKKVNEQYKVIGNAPLLDPKLRILKKNGEHSRVIDNSCRLPPPRVGAIKREIVAKDRILDNSLRILPKPTIKKEVTVMFPPRLPPKLGNVKKEVAEEYRTVENSALPVVKSKSNSGILANSVKTNILSGISVTPVDSKPKTDAVVYDSRISVKTLPTKIRNLSTETCARIRPFISNKKKKKSATPAKSTVSAKFPFSKRYLPGFDKKGVTKPNGIQSQSPWKKFVLPSSCKDIEAEKKKKLVKKKPKTESETCARVRPSYITFQCRRCTPYNGLRKEKYSFYFMMHPVRLKCYEPKKKKPKLELPDSRSSKGKWRVTPEMPLDWQYSRYMHGDSPKLILSKSGIHGIGVFTEDEIGIGGLIIEYRGEKIRNSLVDLREAKYRKKGLGSYMFSLDNDETVDATLSGSVARFVNHSCDPNCAAKVITYEGEKHIILYADRYIEAGEELSYNYKLPIEAEKIPCLCGKSNCRKFLN